eukprot:SAG11_NODE_1097_length_5882_cov_3.116376_4_plen_146_part_00
MLFKRQSTYYIIYSECCCACRAGSGAIVLAAQNLSGPWVRQPLDANCAVASAACDGAHAVVHAQGLGLSVIGNTYLWQGERWLSGAHNPAKCPSLCTTPSGLCAQSADYIKGADYSYWVPLSFDANGTVGHFGTFVDKFELDLPE